MFDTRKLAKEIRSRGAKRIFLQIPEGLKMRVQELAEELEKAGTDVFISTDACFGACDLRDHQAGLLGCDLLVHIGHTDFGLESEVPVLYEEYMMDSNPLPILKKGMGMFSGAKRIGLLTTVQYVSCLDDVKKFLEAEDREVFIGKSKRTKYPGQVLGCDFSAAKNVESDVDAFLFIGTGYFHPLGVATAVDRPVLFLNLENRELLNMGSEREMLERIRFAQVEKAKDCKSFGILVSTKPGQMFPQKASRAKKKLEKLGKRACVLVMDEITPQKLLGLKLDCLVNCACPRMTDDSRLFKKPMLNPEELDNL